MPPIPAAALPFFTREMLNYEHGTKFRLRLLIQDIQGFTTRIVGTTREGLFSFRVTPTVLTGAVQEFNFDIPDIPMFVSVFTEEAQLARGNTYVQLFLTANGDRILRLGAGYISAMSAISWPLVQSENEQRDMDMGAVTNGTNPAAGVEMAFNVPDQQKLEILAVGFVLVTSATVANRAVHIVFQPSGTSPQLNVITPANQTASQTMRYSLVQLGFINTNQSDNDIIMPMPRGIVLGPLGSIISETENLQVGDDFSAMNVLVRRSLVLE